MKCYVQSAKCKFVFITFFLLFILNSPRVVSKVELRKEHKGNIGNFTQLEISKLTNNSLSYFKLESKTEESQYWEMVKKNYSIIIALIAICGGFLIASVFLIIALMYNKQTLSQISTASIQIVKSLNEMHKGKVNSGDVLTMHI